MGYVRTPEASCTSETSDYQSHTKIVQAMERAVQALSLSSFAPALHTKCTAGLYSSGTDSCITGPHRSARTEKEERMDLGVSQLTPAGRSELGSKVDSMDCSVRAMNGQCSVQLLIYELKLWNSNSFLLDCG